MEEIERIMDWLILVSIWLLSVVIYFSGRTYFNEKGKNLATREDIRKITEIVESIRLQNNQEIELLKAQLNNTSEALVRRRDVYENLGGSIRIFIQGQFPDQSLRLQRQQEFLDSYISAWLWAPDENIRALNAFIYMNQREPAEDNPKQRKLKDAFYQVIVGLRKDAGFPDTELKLEDFVFVQF
ncbi:hypothetical protein [Methylomonas methanica]|uniref:Uncharacterized protein n=1 Tax=Methylomonas methanica (strain DSM 25384 / MC09) TaxID=857087 RepID=F9ZZJ1_METMM|nr:hypothetical protein [Methylomonas methanica]AEG02384.1 hypothetical protein Metme_4031 [Methylomonas methanica MC09]